MSKTTSLTSRTQRPRPGGAGGDYILLLDRPQSRAPRPVQLVVDRATHHPNYRISTN